MLVWLLAASIAHACGPTEVVVSDLPELDDCFEVVLGGRGAFELVNDCFAGTFSGPYPDQTWVRPWADVPPSWWTEVAVARGDDVVATPLDFGLDLTDPEWHYRLTDGEQTAGVTVTVVAYAANVECPPSGCRTTGGGGPWWLLAALLLRRPRRRVPLGTP